MPERYPSVLLFGPPGSGKGTLGAVIGSVIGFSHMASGDIFRSLDKESELGRLFLSYSTKGELVPDDVTIRLWKDYVDRRIEAGAYDPAREILLLDGIPRNAAQVELMQSHIDVKRVIHLVGDEAELVRRLSKRAHEQDRPDDAKEDVIKRRLEVYRDETRPMLDCYDASFVADVDAIGLPSEVLQRALGPIVEVQRAFAAS
ncbi:MAG: nucleoside monophosphate kinase [Planctomycetota bacterium]